MTKPFTIREADGALCAACRAPFTIPKIPTVGQLWPPLCPPCLARSGLELTHPELTGAHP